MAACSTEEETNETNEPTNTTETENENTENNETSNMESGDKITIKFAAQNDNTPATDAVIKAFNESQDQYVVEWILMNNDSAQMHDQLLTSLSAESDAYDVLSLDVVWAGEFAGAGYLEPIDVNMRENNINKQDYNSGSMASGNYNGKQYTLPFFPDLGLLYYRSDIVSEEDSQKLISGDYTYSDLATMAETYAGQAETKHGIVYQSKQYEGLTVNVTEFTSSFSSIEDGLKNMQMFTKADWVPKDILNFTEGETHVAFEQGMSVFARNWPYQFGRIKAQEEGVTLSLDQVGIAPLPNGGSVGGWLLGISKYSNHPEGAWEFVNFVSSQEGQKIMSTQGGYLPGYNPLLEDSEVSASNEMLAYEGFKNALSTTIARPVSTEYSKLSDLIQIQAHKYLSSGEGLEDTVKQLEQALNE
ncbi:extracellular solute-binding protein [Longirhabdus pacifica]|uniref:extracellular solute-binding protein n=1 Tax=Longirhabdus pacifica TaxID=2305227 RepID=UPI001008D8B9